MTFSSTIWRLLRRNISAGQMIGYAVANIVGLSVILIGILFYCDSQNNNGTDQYFSSNYAVLSKRVSGIGFTPVIFSDDEIDDLQRQSWARRIGRFTSSQFAAKASIGLGGRSMSSYLFFESVPDEFFDTKPHGWTFHATEGFVPIMLCKDYLALYNFGFAIPQGLPQVSEEIIGAIPITLYLAGHNMAPERLDAAVVGFSSRLGTIAVPQSFMDWANNRYAQGEAAPTSRLIVEVDGMKTAEMQDYLEQHNLEQTGQGTDSGKLSHFLGIVSAVVGIGGVVVSALSMFILILSIYLLLFKSQTMLCNLILLGYHPTQISRYYEAVVCVANTIVVVLSVAIAFAARAAWEPQLQTLGLGGASVLPMLLSAATYLIAITCLNIFIIRKNIFRE